MARVGASPHEGFDIQQSHITHGMSGECLFLKIQIIWLTWGYQYEALFGETCQQSPHAPV